MAIFSSRTQTDGSPRQRLESSFEFLDRVDQVYWQQVRLLLEDWIAHYPDGDNRRDLIGRLRSSDDNQHAAAFWELYLHESLRRDGWQVTPHPALPGISRQPDYLATRGSDEFILEITTSGYHSGRAADSHRVQQALAALDGLQTQAFYMWVTYDSIGPQSPNMGPIRRALEDWLSGLDAQQIREAAKAGRLTAYPIYEATSRPGWHFTFRAIPLKEGVTRQPGTRAVGIEGPGAAIGVDHTGPLLRRLEDKAGCYGAMVLPFVIAVLDLSDYSPRDDDYADALYGTLTSQWDDLTRQEPAPCRAADGFWSQGRASAAAVSGVITAWGLWPWTIQSTAPVFWKNPVPPPGVPPLPWETGFLAADGRSIDRSAAPQDTRTFFSLPPEWPGPKRAINSLIHSTTNPPVWGVAAFRDTLYWPTRSSA